MVASVTVAWLVSEGAVHDCAAYVLLALVTLRIVWGFVGPPRGRFADFIRSQSSTLLYARLVIAGQEPRYLGHNPLGGWMIVAGSTRPTHSGASLGWSAYTSFSRSFCSCSPRCTSPASRSRRSATARISWPRCSTVRSAPWTRTTRWAPKNNRR